MWGLKCRLRHPHPHSFTLLITSGGCAIFIGSFLSLCHRRRLRFEPLLYVAAQDSQCISVDAFKCMRTSKDVEIKFARWICTCVPTCNTYLSQKYVKTAGNGWPLPTISNFWSLLWWCALDSFATFAFVSYVLCTKCRACHNVDSERLSSICGKRVCL